MARRCGPRSKQNRRQYNRNIGTDLPRIYVLWGNAEPVASLDDIRSDSCRRLCTPRYPEIPRREASKFPGDITSYPYRFSTGRKVTILDLGPMTGRAAELTRSTIPHADLDIGPPDGPRCLQGKSGVRYPPPSPTIHKQTVICTWSRQRTDSVSL